MEDWMEHQDQAGYAGPITLVEAHNQWHEANGWQAPCPMDCGIGELIAAGQEERTQHRAGIRCGHCKARHDSIEQVRRCARNDHAAILAA